MRTRSRQICLALVLVTPLLFLGCSSSSGGSGSQDAGVQPDGAHNPDTSVQSDPGKNDPGQADTAGSDPGKSDPGQADPGQVDPGQVDPGGSDPGGMDSGPGDMGPMEDVATDEGPVDDILPDTAGGPAEVSKQIAAARGASDGAAQILIDGAWVTYVRPAVGKDPAGFFIQREQAGPALFVAVDPASISPQPGVGDEVQFTVSEMGSNVGQRRVTQLSGLTVLSQGNPVKTLVQDVSEATDLVTALDGYESELISLSATLLSDFGPAGTDNVSAEIGTSGISVDAKLKLRIPDAVRDEVGLTVGCVFELDATPMWRFFETAQPSAWKAGEIAIESCPAPKVVEALALGTNEVRVAFDRPIDPGSLVADGSQFVFKGGLTANTAVLEGKTFVTVNTSLQEAGASYDLTVATTLTDVLGTSLDAGSNTATFSGFVAAATLRINEVNANIDGGCDLIELRVVSGGSLKGIQVGERTGSLVSFGASMVATNDYIVIHLDKNDPNCSPGSPVDETSAKDQQAQASFAANFDTAFDWYSADTGLTATTTVIWVKDAAGDYLDVVFLADGLAGTAAGSSEVAAKAAADAGEWTDTQGNVPADGFIDDAFRAAAVQGLKDSGKAATGASIQRSDDLDTNNLNGWGVVDPPTWGANNAGQSDL